MALIWLSFLLVLSTDILVAEALRCHDDIYGPYQVMEDCRACVIFIAPIELTTIKPTTTTAMILPKRRTTTIDEPSIEELFLFDEHRRRRRRRRRYLNNDTIIHQQCAREINGPLYGYDQTHCYCNSNQCNSNIQRCIYEVTSKRYFACYHGYNSSQHSLEIRHKCRSCRIRMEADFMTYYECLTFGEREHNNQSTCTCQRPMCNQDASTCQRFQSVSSHARTNLIITKSHFESDVYETKQNTWTIPLKSLTTSSITTSSTTVSSTNIASSTTTIMTTTTTITTTTPITSTTTPIITTTNKEDDSSITLSGMSITTPISIPIFTSTITSFPISSSAFLDDSSIVTTETMPSSSSTKIETESEFVRMMDNATSIGTTTFYDNTTSFFDSKPLKTDVVVIKNYGHSLASKFTYCFIVFQFYFVFVIYSM